MSSTSSLPYRAEIDGLRAFAVLPVVFYHFDFKFPRRFCWPIASVSFASHKLTNSYMRTCSYNLKYKRKVYKKTKYIASYCKKPKYIVCFKTKVCIYIQLE